jgi:hypothetical protein
MKAISLRLSRFQTGDANLNFVGFAIMILVILIMLALQGAF